MLGSSHIAIGINTGIFASTKRYPVLIHKAKRLRMKAQMGLGARLALLLAYLSILTFGGAQIENVNVTKSLLYEKTFLLTYPISLRHQQSCHLLVGL